MKKYYHLLLIYGLYCVLIYGLLLYFFLETSYIEGDDASTILYHLMGRDSDIQSPYSIYHSGFDFLLNYLSINENVLRNFAVYLSFFFGGFMLFIFGFILLKIKKNNEYLNKYFVFLIPIFIPEIFFNSVLINPTNIGYVFVLLAFIFLLNYLDSGKIYYLILYAVFFGFGIPFRWSLLMAAPFSLGLFLFYTDLKPTRRQITHFMWSSIFAFLFANLFLNISGYTIKDLVQAFLWGKSYVDNGQYSKLSMTAISLSFLTIPIIICFIAGLLQTFIIQKEIIFSRLIFIFLSISPFFILSFHTSFKHSITLIPILLYFSLIGFSFLIKYNVGKTLLTTSTLFIWFIGIHVDSDGMAYGPGFQSKNISFQGSNNVVPDERVKVKNIGLSFSGGLSMPTPEGFRPLFGYWHVIFGGEWKKLVNSYELNREKVIDIAENKEVILFQDRKTAILQCELIRKGYHASEYLSLEQYTYRAFVKCGDTIVMNFIPEGINKKQWIIDFVQNSEHPIILQSSYSSLVSSIAFECSTCQLLNPFALVLNPPDIAQLENN